MLGKWHDCSGFWRTPAVSPWAIPRQFRGSMAGLQGSDGAIQGHLSWLHVDDLGTEMQGNGGTAFRKVDVHFHVLAVKYCFSFICLGICCYTLVYNTLVLIFLFLIIHNLGSMQRLNWLNPGFDHICQANSGSLVFIDVLNLNINIYDQGNIIALKSINTSYFLD